MTKWLSILQNNGYLTPKKHIKCVGNLNMQTEAGEHDQAYRKDFAKHSSFIIILALTFLGCSQESSEKKSDNGIKVEKEVEKIAGTDQALICLDEGDKVTCKLMTKRVNKDREVEFEWKSPNGKDNREREMILPANHASIYDTRQKKGRAKGLWSVEVEIDDDEEVSTNFRIN